MKLGKAAPEFRDTDLMFASIMRAAPPPENYDADMDLPAPMDDTRMFGNDAYGDCVIAGRAHQTLRFEDKEQRLLLNITDQEVIDEYMKETGGQDSGLVVSRSLRQWRQRGWIAAGQNYKIYSYARLNVANLNQLHTGMAADLGMGIGFQVPQSAIDQFNAGQAWEVVGDDQPILGGHYVYCVAYEPGWITCVTWGRRQKMTEQFFHVYNDEAWAIIDARNKPRKGLIDLNALDDFISGLHNR